MRCGDIAPSKMYDRLAEIVHIIFYVLTRCSIIDGVHTNAQYAFHFPWHTS